MIEPIVKAPAHAQVAARIRRTIETGELAPGDRLPSEPRLAASLGVARATLRAALAELKRAGYVESRRGAQGGLFVIARAARRQTSAPRLKRRQRAIEDMLEFRLAVEPRAARLAAERHDPPHLAAIEAAVAAMRRASDIPSFRQADALFHRAVAEAAGNAPLRRAIEEGRAALFGIVDRADYDVLISHSSAEHAAIAAAIAGRDAEAAERAMAAHIEQARAEVRHVIRATLAGGREASRSKR